MPFFEGNQATEYYNAENEIPSWYGDLSLEADNGCRNVDGRSFFSLPSLLADEIFILSVDENSIPHWATGKDNLTQETHTTTRLTLCFQSGHFHRG